MTTPIPFPPVVPSDVAPTDMELVVMVLKTIDERLMRLESADEGAAPQRHVFCRKCGIYLEGGNK